jgi:hypothetical protein
LRPADIVHTRRNSWYTFSMHPGARGAPDLPEKRIERPEFRLDKSVEVNSHLVKALRAFKENYLVDKGKDPRKLRILVVNPGMDVSAKAAFEESEVNAITESGRHAQFLSARGIPAIKARFERRKFTNEFDFEDERGGRRHFDVIIVLDKDAEPTDRFLYNIPSEGFVLCRAHMANKLRTRGGFNVVGAVDENGSFPILSQGPNTGAWGEVESDAEFIEASKRKIEGIVTYHEAVQALKDAEKRTDNVNVLESYKRLQEEQGNSGYQLPLRETDENVLYAVRRETIRG